MAATSDPEMDSILSTFDQIYEDFKSGIAEMQLLRLSWNTEIEKREALEIICKSLKQENERLIKLNMESLNNIAEQLDNRTKLLSLKEELKRVREELLIKEDEHRKSLEWHKEDYARKVGGLEAQVRGFVLEKAISEATISRLHQDLAAHKTQMQTLGNQVEKIHFDEELKYHLEIQDLKDCLLVEQEEKKELNKKLQHLEKELLISKTKLVEQQQDLVSNRHAETLKLKIMKLRKENEILKRKASKSDEG